MFSVFKTHLKSNLKWVLVIVALLLLLQLIITYSDHEILRTYKNLKQTTIAHETNVSHIFVNLPKEVRLFVELTNEFDAELFIIEPRIIFEVLHEKDKHLLIERKLVDSQVKSNKSNSFSFGIFDSNVHRILNESLLQLLQDNGFVMTVDLNIENLPPILSNTQLPLHLFFTSNFFRIQVAVFYKGSGDWYWIGEFKQKIMNQSFDSPKFGSTQQLFDSFSIGKTIFKDSAPTYLFVNDVKFLAFMNFSKYKGCNRALATKMRNLTNVKSDNQPKMKKRGHDSIELVKLTSDILLVPFFLEGGTAIGWYRHCGIINYDKDNDFAAYSAYASYDSVELIRDVVVKHGYTILETFGFPKMGYELRLINTDPENGYNQIDLFFVYEENNAQSNLSLNEDDVYIAYHYITGDNFYKLRYSRKAFYPLCSSVYIDYKVLVPCNIETYLEEEYGKNWSIPDPNGHFRNNVSTIYWNLNDIPFSYQCLGVGHQFPLRRISDSIANAPRVEKSWNEERKNISGAQRVVNLDLHRCYSVQSSMKQSNVFVYYLILCLLVIFMFAGIASNRLNAIVTHKNGCD